MALALLLALGSQAGAKEYYVNKGVKYHIGDDRASRSVDAIFLETFPGVGMEWTQRFTVDQEDWVRVRIEGIWGVDDCPYCKIIISIDDHDLGRLYEENNRQPFFTPDPLAVKVRPGHTYTLKIASYGKTAGADDFVIENVVVETDANVKFVAPPVLKDPGEPMPTPVPVPQGTCEGSRRVTGWIPAERIATGMVKLESVENFAESTLGAPLKAGEFIEAQLRIGNVSQGALVEQAFEVLAGGAAKGSGWVFSFAPGRPSVVHANMRLGGVYRAARFRASSYKPGWNTVRIARCPDGKASLFVNGVEVGRYVSGLGPSEDILLRVRGLTAEMSPQAY